MNTSIIPTEFSKRNAMIGMRKMIKWIREREKYAVTLSEKNRIAKELKVTTKLYRKLEAEWRFEWRKKNHSNICPK